MYFRRNSDLPIKTVNNKLTCCPERDHIWFLTIRVWSVWLGIDYLVWFECCCTLEHVQSEYEKSACIYLHLSSRPHQPVLGVQLIFLRSGYLLCMVNRESKKKKLMESEMQLRSRLWCFKQYFSYILVEYSEKTTGLMQVTDKLQVTHRYNYSVKLLGHILIGLSITIMSEKSHKLFTLNKFIN